MRLKEIDFSEVGQFSSRDKDYTLYPEKFNDFIAYPFEFEAFKKIIEKRQSINTDRELLVSQLMYQYKDVESSQLTSRRINQLKADSTFTVVTAHQPSLLTGPLYYVFKILSCLNLADKLKQEYPDKDFVPVFILGAEDHDFEEINHLQVFGKKLEWSNEAMGAVGRRSTEGINEIIENLSSILGEKTEIKDLLSGFRDDLQNASDYADFSFRITHRLFDRFGLLILRMDEKPFKYAFRSAIKEEIFNSPSQALIESYQDKLSELGYSKQAHAREINFFYHCGAGRKRIIQEADSFKIVDTNLSFTRAELAEEIDTHPENFSPNVIMRPLFQEYNLPNLAYIGGGGELAYWMERKSQFDHFGIPFPMLIRRNSAMITDERTLKQIDAMGLSCEDFFKDEHEIVKKYLELSDQPDYKLDQYISSLSDVFSDMDERIKNIDPTLVKTSQSELAKTTKSIEQIEFRLKKRIKQKEEVQLNRIAKLKEKLFPGGLQERKVSIFEFMSSYGENLLDEMLPHMDVFSKSLKVFIPEKKGQ